MSMTRKFVEQRLQKERQVEAKNGELRRMLVTHNILAGHSRSDKRVEDLRRTRADASERRDLFTDYHYVKSEQDKERKQMVAEAEERLADELARRSADETRKDQNRRRVCDGSEELRVLKERLHAAKVNKERAQQLLEIEMRHEKDRRLNHKIAEHMENERLEHVELEHKLQIEKLKQRERVKQINQQQIAMKEAQREDAMQEYMKEKDQVQQLVDRIQNEDASELAAKLQKQKESKEMLMKFKIEQAERQEAQEQAEIEENNRIAAFARDKERREEQQANEKYEAEQEKERVLRAMIGEQEAKNKAAEELAQLRNDLHAEEHESEARRKEEAQMRKRAEDKEEMKRAYINQMELQEAKKEAFKQEEEKVRETLLQKFAEDDRIEQMNDQRKRMKIEAHKREAQRLIELRRESFEAAREEEREFHRRAREDEKDRQVIVEEERQRLLKEHAVGLKDFLPKGTLEHMDDFRMVFPEAVSSTIAVA